MLVTKVKMQFLLGGVFACLGWNNCFLLCLPSYSQIFWISGTQTLRRIYSLPQSLSLCGGRAGAMTWSSELCPCIGMGGQFSSSTWGHAVLCHGLRALGSPADHLAGFSTSGSKWIFQSWFKKSDVLFNCAWNLHLFPNMRISAKQSAVLLRLPRSWHNLAWPLGRMKIAPHSPAGAWSWWSYWFFPSSPAL